MNMSEPKNQSDNPLVSIFKQALFAELYSYHLFERETRDYYLFKPHETGDSAWLIPSQSEGQTCEARRFTDEVKRPPQPIIPAILPFEHYVSFDRLMLEDRVQDIKNRVRESGSDLAKEVNRCFINVLMTSVSDFAVQIQDDKLENFLARIADELTGRGFNADRFLFPKCLKNRLLLEVINQDDDIDNPHYVGRTNTGLRAFWSAELPDNMAFVFDSTAGIVIAQEPRYWCGEGRRAFHVEVGGLLKTNLILKNLQAVIPIAMADSKLTKSQPAVTHLPLKQENTTELLERLKRLLAEDPTLAARLAAITGDGNVVGDHNVATVNRLSAGDYAIQIGQLHLTLSPDQLRSLPVSVYTASPLPAVAKIRVVNCSAKKTYVDLVKYLGIQGAPEIAVED